MNPILRIFVLSICSFAALTGCTASTDSPEEETSSTEDELKASECPPSVDVLLLAPTIMSDATLKRTWERDLSEYESNPKAAAQEQLTILSEHVTEARSQKAVKLHGTRGRACSYKTVDAQTGQPNGYRFWFAKVVSYGRSAELQLRIERDLGDPDALFFNQRLKSLSPTSVTVDSAKDARVFAQRHEEGYHGEPDGPNAWIGYAKASVTLSQ